ncbi:hypothetical protein [Burkholderia puraquae]|nr:hypothetical protein [Burkholderia puraquae]
MKALRSELTGAAQFINELPMSEAPPPLRRAAEVVIGAKASVLARTAGEDIRFLRDRLRMNPRDGISHVDLARAFTISGDDDSAAKHLRIASYLLPHNRFVLRSTARFYAHRSEPERARHLLANSPKTARDPWLMASLVTFETIMDDSRSTGRALKMLKDERFAPADTTELACALSVVEYKQGAWRESRKLLNKGLRVPNDNAVAQALWFMDTTRTEIRAEEAWLRNDFAAEARYYERSSTSDFDSAVDEALAWYRDEPFSTRPLQAASYLLGILGRYEEGKRWATEGLRLRGSDSGLRNNLAFVLMASGELEEGERELKKAIRVEQQEKRISPHTKANVGMLCYRHGEFEAGERWYRTASNEYAQVRGGGDTAALALCHMAVEATRAGAPNAVVLVTEAESILKKYHYPDARLVLDSIKKVEPGQLPKPAYEKTPLVLNARTWRHDAANNILIVESLKAFKE